MSRTLSAYHAYKSEKQADFDVRVTEAITQRQTISAAGQAQSWLEEIAQKTGVAVEFVKALDGEIQQHGENLPLDSEGLTRWFFAWLAGDPERMSTVLAHRVAIRPGGDKKQGALYKEILAETVWAWMSGETLRQLAVRLGGKPDEAKSLNRARNFVVREIPNLAYCAGLATLIRRRQIELTGEGKMPTALATFALCVREDASAPELAALRIMSSGRSLSRQKLKELWHQVEAHVRPGHPYERFRTMRKRVSEGLQALTPF
jgi:hypothetical protein